MLLRYVSMEVVWNAITRMESILTHSEIARLLFRECKNSLIVVCICLNICCVLKINNMKYHFPNIHLSVVWFSVICINGNKEKGTILIFRKCVAELQMSEKNVLAVVSEKQNKVLITNEHCTQTRAHQIISLQMDKKCFVFFFQLRNAKYLNSFRILFESFRKYCFTARKSKKKIASLRYCCFVCSSILQCHVPLRWSLWINIKWHFDFLFHAPESTKHAETNVSLLTYTLKMNSNFSFTFSRVKVKRCHRWDKKMSEDSNSMANINIIIYDYFIFFVFSFYD